MILCIDIGNSNIAFGIHNGSEWKYHWRMATGADRTPDEYEVLMRGFLSADNIDPRQIDRISISSVVPGLNEAFKQVSQDLFGVKPFWVHYRADLGLEIRIDTPSELGPDLMANAVAGFRKFGKSCIVADFGTALSFTVVEVGNPQNPKPGIIGGAIAPGLGSAMKALSSNTAQLPHVNLALPPKAIGTNTRHCIQSGITYGYIGLVEKLVERMSLELPETPAVIATGGMSSILASATTVFTEIDPWLTLDGLRIIHERNHKG